MNQLADLQIRARLQYNLAVEERLQTIEGVRYYYEVTSSDGSVTEVVQHIRELPGVIHRMGKETGHASYPIRLIHRGWCTPPITAL